MSQQMADSPGGGNNQEAIRHAGRIPQTAFIASISVLFGLAVIATLTRFLTRLLSRGRLYTDDYFVLFALVCLCAGTGLMIHSYRIVFVDEAAATNATVVIAPGQLDLLFGSLGTIDALFCVMWTATFSVKASFLALFRQLIRRVSGRLTIYYWCTVVLTFLAWGFFECEDFIVCPYFRAQVRKCLPQTPYVLTASLSAVGTVLDITTDLMIVSIPVILLHKTQLALRQKVSLGCFLCLSLVMVCIALVRVSGFRIKGAEDITWDLYWVYMEAGVACIMSSVAVMRTTFGVVPGSRSAPKARRKMAGGEWFSMQRERMSGRNGRKGESSRRFWWEIEGPENDGVSALPAARLSRVRTSSVEREEGRPTTDVMGSGSYGYHTQLGREEHGAKRGRRGPELC